MRARDLSILFVFFGLVASGCNTPSDDLTIFQADLSPANEVPPRASAASGASGVSLDGTTVHYSIEVHNIQNVLFAHIHTAPVGVNGPIRVTLYPGPTTGPVDGVLAQGSFTAADVTGITFEELLSQMRAGTAYVNVHTTTFPGGEVRGQLRLLQ
jgi:hypothetical protein